MSTILSDVTATSQTDRANGQAHPSWCSPFDCRTDELDGTPVRVHAVRLYADRYRSITLHQVVATDTGRVHQAVVMTEGRLDTGLDAERAALVGAALARGAELAAVGLPVTPLPGIDAINAIGRHVDRAGTYVAPIVLDGLR